MYFTNAIVGHQIVIQGAYRHITKRFPINTLNVVWGEERHLGIFFGERKGNIRNHHPKRQGLNADFFIGVFTFGIQEAQDIRMVCVEIDRPAP